MGNTKIWKTQYDTYLGIMKVSNNQVARVVSGDTTVQYYCTK